MVDSSPIGIAKLSAGWAIALSILLILAGILAIVVPPVAGIGVAIVVAWLVLLGGFAHLAIAWHIRSTGGLLWELLVGLLYLAIAIYMLVWPVAGLASLTLLLACYLFAKGIIVLILAYRIRHHSGSGWLFFDGVIALDPRCDDRPELALEQRMGHRNTDRHQHALRRNHSSSHGNGSSPPGCEAGLAGPALS